MKINAYHSEVVWRVCLYLWRQTGARRRSRTRSAQPPIFCRDAGVDQKVHSVNGVFRAYHSYVVSEREARDGSQQFIVGVVVLAFDIILFPTVN